MPRPSLGPRLWYDSQREAWIIRDGSTFIRTGARGWKKAEERLAEYMRSRPTSLPVKQPSAGFVYFVTADVADFPIKIGFAERSNVRIRELQTGCPYPLVMLATLAGTYKTESALHRQFKADRMCGEWFRRSPELMALIESHRASEVA